MRFPIPYAAVATVIGVVVAACSSDPARPNPSDPDCVIPANGDFRDSTQGRVVMQGFNYIAENITVRKGTTGRWVYCDGPVADPHTVTSDAGLWDSGSVDAGQKTYLRAFAVVGSFPYYCRLHALMQGVVSVVD